MVLIFTGSNQSTDQSVNCRHILLVTVFLHFIIFSIQTLGIWISGQSKSLKICLWISIYNLYRMNFLRKKFTSFCCYIVSCKQSGFSIQSMFVYIKSQQLSHLRHYTIHYCFNSIQFETRLTYTQPAPAQCSKNGNIVQFYIIFLNNAPNCLFGCVIQKRLP